MKTLQKIGSYLKDILVDNKAAIKDDQDVIDFINGLITSSNTNDKRLLFCLGIDIKNAKGNKSIIEGIKSCLVVAWNLKPDLRTFDDVPLHVKFSLAQRDVSPELHKPCIKAGKSKVRYARVSTFRSYMLYVVEINKGDKNPEITNIDSEEMNIYWEEFNEFASYQKIHITRLGRNNSWVFVADSKELEPIEDTKELIDRLGFYVDAIDPNDNYVKVEYDDEFHESTYQPDVLTGDWGDVDERIKNGNEFFLSAGANKDRWGRTFSVSGKLEPLKERVHENFDYDESKHYQISSKGINDLDELVETCSSIAIIKEAYKRFVNA